MVDYRSFPPLRLFEHFDVLNVVNEGYIGDRRTLGRELEERLIVCERQDSPLDGVEALGRFRMARTIIVSVKKLISNYSNHVDMICTSRRLANRIRIDGR